MTELKGLFRPKTVEEATALLADAPDAKIIAGGASLVAMINARLLEPKVLVSLGGIDELQGIGVVPGGGFRIGAMTRHRDVASDRRLTGTLAVVSSAASVIANETVRNMGTIGGAVAHADPGLDYPAALVVAGAQVEIASRAGRRRVPASEFFVDWYATALEEGEMVSAVYLPPAVPGVGLYDKLARVAGDFAIVSVALTMSKADIGVATRVAIGACGPKPVLVEAANRLLSGNFREKEIGQAGDVLAAAADPVDDVRGTAEYRRILIPRMLARAVAQARERL